MPVCSQLAILQLNSISCYTITNYLHSKRNCNTNSYMQQLQLQSSMYTTYQLTGCITLKISLLVFVCSVCTLLLSSYTHYNLLSHFVVFHNHDLTTSFFHTHRRGAKYLNIPINLANVAHSVLTLYSQCISLYFSFNGCLKTISTYVSNKTEHFSYKAG